LNSEKFKCENDEVNTL